MKWGRGIVLVAVGLLAFSGTAQFSGLERAKGFKLILDYYSTPSGAQKKKSVLTGTEGNVLTSYTIYLINPRIERYREDGSLDTVATASDAFLNRTTSVVSSTNWVSFRDADTNFFLSGRGFLWQQSNSVLMISNQSYTSIAKTMFTNSPSKKTNAPSKK